MKGFKELMQSPKGAVIRSMKEPTPCIYINSKQWPKVKDMELGKEYTIKVKMVSRDESLEDNDGEKMKDGATHIRGEFELAEGSGDKKEDAKEDMDEEEGYE